MSEQRFKDLPPAVQEDILNRVYEEMLSPQFDPEKYDPTEKADPSSEEVLGKMPEGAKKLFAYASRLFAWCLSPPDDTPDVLTVLSLKLEAAQQLLVEEIMRHFGDKLKGRQFEIRHDWTIVATKDLRDGSCEDLCHACMLGVRRIEPVGDDDTTVCVPVLATGGWSAAESDTNKNKT